MLTIPPCQASTGTCQCSEAVDASISTKWSKKCPYKTTSCRSDLKWASSFSDQLSQCAKWSSRRMCFTLASWLTSIWIVTILSAPKTSKATSSSCIGSCDAGRPSLVTMTPSSRVLKPRRSLDVSRELKRRSTFSFRSLRWRKIVATRPQHWWTAPPAL